MRGGMRCDPMKDIFQKIISWFHTENVFSLPDVLVSPSGLKIWEEIIGKGAEAARGQLVSVHYTGWICKHGRPGRKFDSSRKRGAVFKFPLGFGRVIAGWDEGVASMRVGGKRWLWIPAALGYGKTGAGYDIPPNADLIFEVELVAVEEG